MKPISRNFFVMAMAASAAIITAPLSSAGETAAAQFKAKANEAAGPVHPGASGLAIPRFVSLSSDTVNMRAGPGVRYPITWVYRRKGTPFMVMAEFEYWRKVRDADGTEGWMHRSLLSGRRMALVRGGIIELRRSPKDDAPVALRAEVGVIGHLLACRGLWCEMGLNDGRAWIRRSDIFGALPNEEF